MIIEAKPRNSYEILENNEVKGTLKYKSLFQASADFHTVNDGNHSLKWFFGFLVAKFKITQNDRETIKLKMNFRGHFSIITENGIEYKLISSGFFNRRTFIENQESNELIEISQKYNWKRWNYDYEIANSETPPNNLLSLIAVYALNYQQKYRNGIMMVCIFSLKIIADFLSK